MSECFHVLPDHLFEREVRVHVVGCGGTGSQLLPRLAQLSKCMIALGHPGGLAVTVWDDDTVSEHNCLRQNFFLPDVGLNKAVVMVNRCNMAHGLNWVAKPCRFSRHGNTGARPIDVDFIIGCVDSKQGRREIDGYVRDSYRDVYWIDSGNEAVSGQVVVGSFSKSVRDRGSHLPLVSDLYPEIIAAGDTEEDAAPSCSARESIFRQGLATNAMAANWIYAWLAEALRHGKIGWSGVFFNLESGRVSPIPVSEPTASEEAQPETALAA